jgi:hypothetical protein
MNCMEERRIMMGTLAVIYAVVNDLADSRGKTRSSEGKIFLKNIEVDNIYKITSRGTNSKQKGKNLCKL